mmetsp:Transcript_10958/g.16528  ORF Transcript_10958/g.16528 Transcript_10958/m.16528 type:complete len:194 (-) Transcript_10958:563-1144(-)
MACRQEEDNMAYRQEIEEAAEDDKVDIDIQSLAVALFEDQEVQEVDSYWTHHLLFHRRGIDLMLDSFEMEEAFEMEEGDSFEMEEGEEDDMKESMEESSSLDQMVACRLEKACALLDPGPMEMADEAILLVVVVLNLEVVAEVEAFRTLQNWAVASMASMHMVAHPMEKEGEEASRSNEDQAHADLHADLHKD